MVNSQITSPPLTIGSSSQRTFIFAESYLRRTYRSPIFHTAVHVLSSEVINRLDINRRVNVNTFTPLPRFMISARRDAKSWKGVQGGARGRKWCWRYIWRCFWSVFVIETIIQEVLVLSLFFFVLGVSWVQIWQYGSKVYFCPLKKNIFLFSLLSTISAGNQTN